MCQESCQERQQLQCCEGHGKPTLVKSLGKNRDKLDNCFIELCLNFKFFKEDIIATDNVKEEYYDLIDKSDNVLEAQDNTENKDGRKEVARRC